jgi:multiple sugar transport system substrate-binding protein
MKQKDKHIVLIACALFVVASVLIITLRDRDNGDERSDSVVDNHIMENYIYIVDPAFSLSSTHPPIGMMVHEDTIYYWYDISAPQVVSSGDDRYEINHRHGTIFMETTTGLSRETVSYWLENLDSEIVIVGLAADGSGTTETRIAVSGWNVSAGGLRITDDGDFAIIISSFDNESNNTVTYGVYDRQGEVIYTQELIGIDMPLNAPFRIDQVVYADDGSIAVLVSYINNEGRLFMIGSDGMSRGWLRYNTNQSIIRLHDGRVVALRRYDADSYLYELDFDAGDWGDSIALTTPRARNLITTGDNHTFDFLVDDGRNIIGYILDGNIRTPLLDWLEMRPIAFNYSHADTFSDGRPVIMFNPVYSYSDRSIAWNTDIFVFTPALRAEIENRTVLTIGGLRFHENIRNEVNSFNRGNINYQIELREYGGNDIDIDISKAHFLIDMLTGQGPDIIYDPGNLMDSHEYLIDLYPLIDADSEISRPYFFPNALSAMEAPDGTLPVVNSYFSVYTMVTMRETAEQLEPLTFSSIRSRLEEPDEPDLFGMWSLSNGIFLPNSVFMSNGDFIDWSNNIANFEKESFVDLLEISAHLPSFDEVEENLRRMSRDEESIYWETLYWDGLRSGHILFLDTLINTVTSLQALHAALGDIAAVGVPTENGGRHALWTFGEIGISAMSGHQEAAWSFVRRLLLPEAVVPPYALPLRIDRFEEQIADAMTQRFVGGVEQSIAEWLGNHYQVLLYAMTEEEAADIRALVYNADLPIRYNETIGMILIEESQLFFDGRRSAEATARAIQTRVQAYLDER